MKWEAVIPGVSCFNAANAALRKGVTSGVKAHSVILTAVISAGYRDKQKIIHGTLETILEETKGEKIAFEYMIYVGDFLTNRYDMVNRGK